MLFFLRDSMRVTAQVTIVASGLALLHCGSSDAPAAAPVASGPEPCAPGGLQTVGTVASGINGIVAMADQVYFVSYNGKLLGRFPRCGGALEALSNDEPGAFSLTRAGDELFWANQFNGSSPSPNHQCVRAWSAAGATAKSLACSVTGFQIAVAGASAYFTTGGSILTIPLSGGAAVDLSGSHPATGIAAGADRLVYSTTNGDELRSVPFTGGPSTLLASGNAARRGVVVEGTTAYFLDRATGKIQRVSLTGGAAELLATIPSADTLSLDPRGLLVGTSLPAGAYLIDKTVATPTPRVLFEPRPSRLLAGLASDDVYAYLADDAGGTDAVIRRVAMP